MLTSNTLMAAFAVVFVVYLVISQWRMIRRNRVVRYRYDLYRLRDELVREKIEGRIRRDEFAWNQLYPVVNVTIVMSKHLTLPCIVRGVAQVDKRIRVENVSRQYEAAPENIKRIFREYASTMWCIVGINSWVLIRGMQVRVIGALIRAILSAYVTLLRRTAMPDLHLADEEVAAAWKLGRRFEKLATAPAYAHA